MLFSCVHFPSDGFEPGDARELRQLEIRTDSLPFAGTNLVLLRGFHGSTKLLRLRLRPRWDYPWLKLRQGNVICSRAIPRGRSHGVRP